MSPVYECTVEFAFKVGLPRGSTCRFQELKQEIPGVKHVARKGWLVKRITKDKQGNYTLHVKNRRRSYADPVTLEIATEPNSWLSYTYGFDGYSHENKAPRD